MREKLYRYNSETCQYERIRVKPLSVVMYACNVLLGAAAMLAGLLMLHDLIFDSEKEVAFRKENYALAKNHATLAAQLTTIEASLDLLREKDEKLHMKFFGAPLVTGDDTPPGIADHQILLAGPARFRRAVSTIKAHTAALFDRSAATSSFFAGHVQLDKEARGLLKAIPTLQPVQPWETEKVISGFGSRINPFHKGLYEHPGIDVAVPRGTAIVATASGTVTEVKKSKLQAGYGNYIEISHGHGFITRYAHMETIDVRRGRRVSKGDVIGTAGSSGGSVAPHLHYEIIRDGQQVDPAAYMVEGMSAADHHYMTVLSARQNQSLD